MFRPSASWIQRPFHPVLFAAYPVLFLFAANIDEQVTMAPLGPALLASVAIVLAVQIALTLAMRNAQRAALVTTILVAAFFAYGHARTALGEGFTNEWLGLAAWGVLVGVVLAVALRLPLGSLTAGLNVIAIVLVAINTIPITRFVAPPRVPSSPTTGGDEDGLQAQADRDIYYVIFDRYAGERTLRELYDFDNSAFLDELRDRGFFVAEDSQANYLKTALSLASSLSMDYLPGDALRTRAADGGDWTPIYEMLLGPYAVEERLQEIGYSYVHLGSVFDATATNSEADRVLRFSEESEFDIVLRRTTLLGALDQIAPSEDAVAQAGDRRLVYRQHTQYQLDRMDEMTELPGPKFVFAHVLLPHPPWIFNREGEYVSPEAAATRSGRENYLEQVRYANRRILQFVDRLTAGENDPIILIQSDEGPLPSRYAHDEAGFDWTSATEDELQEKMGILNAYYLPGVDDPGLYSSVSPVNSFRIVLNAYFDAGLPLLPDRSYIFPDHSNLYDFRDITELLPTAAGDQ